MVAHPGAGGKPGPGPVANVAQAERWNGDTGQRWLAQRERNEAVRRRLLPHLFRAAAIAPGARALDVGCGCGETTIIAARSAGPGGAVLGLDLSAPLLAVARRLADDAGVAGVEFTQGDAQVQPLPPARYDVVISSFGVMFFDDPGLAFGNLLAALRPGGRLAFLCWQDDLTNEVFSIPLQAFRPHTPLAGLAGIDRFADPDWVAELLGGVGFTEVGVAPIREPAWIGSDVVDVLDFVRGSTRVRELTARLADEALASQVFAEIAAEFSARQRPDGVWVEAAAWLVTARGSAEQGRAAGPAAS